MCPVERKRPRPRRAFTEEFEADIVERCLKGDRSVAQVAHDFDLTVSAVRGWVKQARSTPVPAAMVSRPRRKRSCPSCAGRTAGRLRTGKY
jgi:transposase-like protein